MERPGRRPSKRSGLGKIRSANCKNGKMPADVQLALPFNRQEREVELPENGEDAALANQGTRPTRHVSRDAVSHQNHSRLPKT